MSTNNSNTDFSNWWNDGQSKLKKIKLLFFNWWDNGTYKPLKAIYVSLFLHIIFAIFWAIFWVLEKIL